jgi:NAD(P)-dependent dehydrogenase (short-subunit alcohol dehydrogenase family)/acyl carrier protein
MLVLADRSSLTGSFLKLAKEKYQHVTWVRQGEAFRKHDDGTIELNPEHPEDYDALFKELSARGLHTHVIVDFSNVTPDSSTDDLTRLAERSFFNLLFLAQSLGRTGITSPLKLVSISNGLRQVTGVEQLQPEKAIALGPCLVLPREYPNIKCQSIDITVPTAGSRQEQLLAEQILLELFAPKMEPVVAYRDNRRWLQTYEPVPLPEVNDRAVLKDGGVYLITGGRGGLGLEIAEYLARACRANLVLVNRSSFPAREEWTQWLETNAAEDAVSKTIEHIRRIEELGSQVLVLTADVANEKAMREVFARTREQFKEINGIVHAAGVPAGGLMQTKKAESVREILAAKVRGTRVLEKLVADAPLDFFVLFSSLSSIVGRLGQVDYVGANAFLDLFAQDYRARTGCFTVSINWSAWEQVGMAAHLFRSPGNGTEAQKDDLENYQGRIPPTEGLEAFDRILHARIEPQVIVCPQDLQLTFEQAATSSGEQLLNALKAHEAPKVAAASLSQNGNYVPPQNDAERIITQIWQDVLGIEQVGVHDNFFDLGGSSLFAIQVLSRLRKEFNVEVPPAMIFEGATVSALARLLTQDQDAKPAFKEQQSRGERRKQIVQGLKSTTSKA